VTVSLRSITVGFRNCFLLNESSCRVNAVARSAAFRISPHLLARLILRFQSFADQIGVADDGGQQVVEVVGDAAASRPIASIFCACLSCSSRS
jgi:hypothetical protein